MSEASSRSQPRLKDRLEAICMEMITRRILFAEAVSHFEKSFITEVLNRNDGNLTRTAKTLGIHRNTLAKKVAQFRIKKRSRRS